VFTVVAVDAISLLTKAAYRSGSNHITRVTVQVVNDVDRPGGSVQVEVVKVHLKTDPQVIAPSQVTFLHRPPDVRMSRVHAYICIRLLRTSVIIAQRIEKFNVKFSGIENIIYQSVLMLRH
jgi:hypothetical protein